MKLSIAIGDTHALPSAFVVYRGFEKCIPKAARLGYDGVELALKRADEINGTRLRELLNDTNMEVSCISTGQVYADTGLMITHEDAGKRQQVTQVLKEFIDLAETFGGIVNLGRVRGNIGDRPRQHVEELFIEVARDLCQYALPKSVNLILEPVNRYEIDFINSVEEGVDLLNKINRSNMLLMPDIFHMNIEDKGIGPELSRNIHHIKYIHFADSNRMAPGQGHIDFVKIFDDLKRAEYDGWISVEILPKPDPDVAAKQAIDFLSPYINRFNKQQSVTKVYGK
jgi:sugar phosphate isomerase/epimerase